MEVVLTVRVSETWETELMVVVASDRLVKVTVVCCETIVPVVVLLISVLVR